MPRCFRSATSAAAPRSTSAAAAGGVGLDRTVVVPIAVVELDESHAALGQPPGEQAVAGKRAVAPLGAVQVEHVLRLVVHIHQAGHAGLHAESHFVLADPGGNFGIVDRIVLDAVELLDGVDQVALPLGVDPLGIAYIQHGIAHAAKLDPLESAGQKTGMPLPGGDRLFLPELAGRDHDDEARQVFGLATQSVQQPGTGGRPAGDHRTRVHERVGRIVIDRFGMQRADDAHLVGHHFAEQGKDRC